MGKRRRRSGNLHRGPFSAGDFDAGLRLDGWFEVPHTRHRNYRHPVRPGKVQVDAKWTGVKPGYFSFRMVMEQAGYTKDELLRLLNGRPLS